MRAIHVFAPILSVCCAASAALAQTFEANDHKYLYVEPCRAKVQSVFRDGMGQVFVVSVGLSIRNSAARPIDAVTVDLLDRWDNVLAAKTRRLAVKPGEARADSIEVFGLIISADETKSPAYAGTTRIIEDLEPPLNAPFQKHVTGKKGQRECFSPVLPIVGGCVQRKKCVKSLVR